MERLPVRVGEFGVLDALTDVAHAEFANGDPRRAAELAAAGVAVADAMGDTASARYFLFTGGRALFALGHPDVALQWAEELERRTVDDDEPYWRAKAVILRALSIRREGRYHEVLELIAKAWVLVGTPDGTRYNQVSAAVLLSEALRTVELYEQADAVMWQVAPLIGHGAVPGVLVEGLRTLSEWAAGLQLLGRPEGAHRVVETMASRALLLLRLTEHTQDSGPRLFAHVGLAYAELSAGEPEMALRHVESVQAEVEQRRGRPEWFVGTATRAVALLELGRLDEAEHHLRALRSAAETGLRDVWSTMADDALLTLAVRRHGDHPALEHASRMFRRAQELLWAERSERFAAMLAQVQIHELQVESRRVAELSVLDGLTGVGNRRAIQGFLDHAQGSVGALFIDVDNFKEVNDTFSYLVGDEVLVRIADELRAFVRPGDLVARYGGDEFVVLFDPWPADSPDLDARAAELVARVRGLAWDQVHPGLHVTISVGAAITADSATLLGELSHAVLDAKRAGRDTRVTRRS
ncbi:GGDEF domain-containing protein [Cellulomonas marina]|uniref:Diguanylate cyclase (GGDEF) domain-containing protein n=1 Tax=Cellulomonas marina TaxID=988821 RepID=A0A1I0YSW8_9CELL|nr:GGDEF domain-containing protein [Cellulomonas marina]GIG27523.1 hypothetical protein Cma02nite_01230 [Cellulomonas marina]SFB16394.1 diguanylate cyclase (GGDEF) domain-containing protein [Cellulomonas marina]